MTPTTRARLTSALAALSADIAADLRAQIRAPGPLRERAEQLHADEATGDAFELWTDLLARRAAVMWVLRSLYVRVLEDRGLLVPSRLLDRHHQDLFHVLAPDLGETAFLRWIYRDLAAPESGLAELFTLTPAEIALPSAALSRRLLEFWREIDPDSGELLWRFDDESFDSRLLGDLYQDLDPVVKQRYALLQTPDFVVDFILERTLDPAIARWGADTVRVVDPACGSGHFLLAAYERIVARMRSERDAAEDDDPGGSASSSRLSDAEIARHALTRIVGIDINDYACALARARLVMAALEASGTTDLSAAADLHPQVFWADGLDQVEHDVEPVAVQPRLIPDVDDGSRSGADGKAAVALALAQAASTTATLTRPEVRERLKPHVQAGFHVVVANPPYITEKDEAKKRYHKEKIGGEARYLSAYRLYSLAAPFVERCFQLALPGGRVGVIVANSFMKRVFGSALVEQVLPRHSLDLVVDTSGAYIPGHGTPTVLLFGTPDLPPSDVPIRAVMGKRGEPSVPQVPAEGLVWRSIVDGADVAGFENEFVSVDELPRRVFSEHPWSLQGGGATKLKVDVESASPLRLDDIADSIGITSFTLEDDVYILPPSSFRTLGIPSQMIRPMVTGDGLRDWRGDGFDWAFWPYDDDFQALTGSVVVRVGHLWFFRTNLSNSKMFGGVTKIDAGLRWFEYGRLTGNKLRTPLSIAFAFVATHNHFVLDRGGKVFNRSAPVIKLPPNASVDEHLALLGLLNSAVGDFWMKQVFFSKGYGAAGDGGRMTAIPWEDFYEHDATKLALFPLPVTRHTVLEAFARALDAHGSARVADSARAAVDAAAGTGATDDAGHGDTPAHLALSSSAATPDAGPGGTPDAPFSGASPRAGSPTAAGLRAALAARRERDRARLYAMVGLQDELDWLCYQLYGIEARPEGDDGASAGSGATFDVEAARAATSAADLRPTVLDPDEVPPLAPGLRPFEIALAREDAERRAAIARGETASQQPTEWFSRHGWEAHTDTAAIENFIAERTGDAALAAGYRGLVEERLARTADSRALSLVEQPTYKRRWYQPDYEDEEREALEGWLADRLEDWAKLQRDPWTVRQAAVALEPDAAVQAVSEVLAGRRDYSPEKELGRLVLADSVPNNKMHVFKGKGLEKRAAWERTWQLQRAEDRGEEVTVPVPPKYRSADFRKVGYWRLRGKLDVPKERFIAFTEMPGAAGEAALYGWAGWTPRERARVLLELDEKAERAGAGLEARYGLLWGAWFLLPYVAWESEAAADEFRTIIGSLVGTAGVTEEMLAQWAQGAGNT